MAASPFDNKLEPQFISIRGISEGTWERKRPIWLGDPERDRAPSQKKMKTKHGGDEDVDTLDGGKQ